MRSILTTLANPRWRHGAMRVSAVALAAALLSAGCSGEGSTGPSAGVGGNYQLTTVDFETLPVTIHHGPWLDPATVTFWNLFHYEITAAELELDDDDHFSLTFDWWVVADGEEFTGSLSAEGFYEVDGNEVWLASEDETLGSSVGTVSGRTITFEVDVMNKGITREFVFQR